ncbi:MAG: PQQ-binding-like beta-propeller repeat protein [Dokdonella sp.]
MAAESQGGAFVAGERFEAVSRIAADGSLVWTRRVPAQWFRNAAGSSLLTASCEGITSLQQGSGRVNWQRRLSFPNARCLMSGFTLAADANLYASVQVDAYSGTDSSWILKLDPQGLPLWQIDLPDPDGRLLGVDAGRVYVATPSRLQALDAQSGAALWQSLEQNAEYFLVQTTPPRPVAVAAGTVIGYSPDSGEVEWNTPIALSGHAEVVGDSVLIESRAGLARIHATDGTIVWISELPASDAMGHGVDQWLGFGGLDQGRFLAVARVESLPSQPAPLVQWMDFDTGQAVEQVGVQATTQGVWPEFAVDGESLYSIHAEQDPVLTRFRLRSVDAGTGVESWTRSEPLIDPSDADTTFPPGAILSASSGLVAAVLAQRSDSGQAIAVSTWDSMTGAPHWRSGVGEDGEVWTSTSLSNPRIDADRNVLVSLATYVECVFPDICARYQLRKLAALDGSLLWTRGYELVTQMEPPYLQIPEFELLGDDVILSEGFQLLRLDGDSGAVKWSADLSSFDSIFWLHATDDGDILVNGFRRWGKIEGETGIILWSGPAPALSCQPSRCSNPTTHALPDGNLLQVSYYAGDLTITTSMVALLHTDGSGTYERWFPGSGTDSSLRIDNVGITPQGGIWMRLREFSSGVQFTPRWLTRFDLDTGQFVGRQALGIIPRNIQGQYASPYRWLGPPENGRILAGTEIRDMPAVLTGGAGLFDVSIHAQGNVSISASVPGGSYMSGERLPFVVNVAYEGDVAIDGLQLNVSLPWGGAVTDLSCSTGGEDSCAIDMRDGDLTATFNLLPGAGIEIQGEVQVLDGDDPEPALGAVVQGPTGLLEIDSTDNAVLVRTSQSLFHDGFDSSGSH